MGCIEITFPLLQNETNPPINRNMGCIEIQLSQVKLQADIRLIETCDVLKSVLCCSIVTRHV